MYHVCFIKFQVQSLISLEYECSYSEEGVEFRGFL